MLTAAYSLLELLFSLAIILILISAVTFSPNKVIAEYRLNQYAQALIMSLRLARSKAINQAQIISLCASANGRTCTQKKYELGWILFADQHLPRGQRDESKEELIWRQEKLANDISLRANGNASDSVSFYPNARNSTGIGASFYLCFKNDVQQAQVLVLNSRGSLRLSKRNQQGVPIKARQPIKHCLLE